LNSIEDKFTTKHHKNVCNTASESPKSKLLSEELDREVKMEIQFLIDEDMKMLVFRQFGRKLKSIYQKRIFFPLLLPKNIRMTKYGVSTFQRIIKIKTIIIID